MINTKYLKQLKDDEKKDLLYKLGFPMRSNDFRKGSEIIFENDIMTAHSWNHDYSHHDDYDDDYLFLNDYGFAKGTYRLEEKEDILFSFMIDKFGDKYKEDCKAYVIKDAYDQKTEIDNEANTKKAEIDKSAKRILDFLK